MNPNLVLLASLARPSAQPPSMLPPGMPMPPGGGRLPSMPTPGTMPSHVIRPAGAPMASAASRGRGGDNMVAHMTPGEIAVPPQIQTPDVLATLNRAFSEAGANPTSFQAGNPDEKINPETGLPEFGFFDAILPTILGLGGSALLGPAILPALGAGGLGLGAEAAGLIAPAIGGAIGSTVGNVATGHPLGQSLAMGGLGGVGSVLGGALGSAIGTSAVPTTVPGAAAAISEAAPEAAGPGIDADYGGVSPSGPPAAPYGVDADYGGGGRVPWMQKMVDALKDPKSIGSGIGGLAGSALGEKLFPSTYKPPTPLRDSFASGPSLYQPRAAPIFPTADQLRNYGRSGQFNFYPV